MTRPGAAVSGRKAVAPLAAAIDWMVLLQSGKVSAADRERHREWCDADPAHASAWAQVRGALDRSVQPLRQSPLPRPALQATLLRPARRRLVGKALVLGGLGVVAGWQAWRQWPDLAGLIRHADFRTGTAERRTVALDDGSAVHLNARSAIDIHFDAVSRGLHLLSGEIIVTAAPDAARPFTVRTREGRVRALGTRFLVRQDDGETLVLVLAHRVEARNGAGGQRVLGEGEAMRFTADRLDPVRTDQASLAGWQDGMLVAANQPLAEVVAALRPYHRGLIRVSAAAGSLRVLGAFPIDDPDRVLDSLAQTLPLKVTRYGGWLVTIDRRD